jgi:hypothetical protein
MQTPAHGTPVREILIVSPASPDGAAASPGKAGSDKASQQQAMVERRMRPGAMIGARDPSRRLNRG